MDCTFLTDRLQLGKKRNKTKNKTQFDQSLYACRRKVFPRGQKSFIKKVLQTTRSVYLTEDIMKKIH